MPDYCLALAVGAGIFILIALFAIADRRKSLNPTPSAKEIKENATTVERLFDYTKFHITVYTTLATLLVAAASDYMNSTFVPSLVYIRAAVVAILGAGLAAGVVAASMPEGAGKVKVWDWRTGPYNWHVMSIRSWTFVEHTSFWVAAVLALLAFATGKHVGPQKQ